jgi:hypothetical protein
MTAAWIDNEHTPATCPSLSAALVLLVGCELKTDDAFPTSD